MTLALQSRQPFLVPLMAGLLAAVLLAGCGGAGNGQGLDETGNLPTPAPPAGAASGAGTTVGASGNVDATLAWVQTNVFGGVCTQCHTGASAPLGLDWSSRAATCANVSGGLASVEVPRLKEVDRGNPDASYVVWKIQGAGPAAGDAIVGARMPAGNPALTAAEIKNIRDWIGDGAPGC